MADTQLRLIASVIDRASGPLRAIAGRIRAIAGSNYGQRIANSFGTATAAAAKLGGALRGAVVGGLAAIGIGAVSAGAAFAGLLNLLTQSRDRLDALDEQAQQTGFSLQQLRELQFISKRGGVEWDTMSAGLLQMSKRVGELKSGTGAFGKQLAKTYPQLYKQLKASKSNTQAFSILHKAMSKIEDPAKRIAFAMKVFGKPGAEIAKMGMSTEDFLAQMERARKFKGILPEDAGERMGAANDAVDDLKDSLEGLVDLISYETAPAFTETVNAIAEFVAANRDAIATGFKEFLIGVKDALKGIDWSGVVEGFKSFGRGVAEVTTFLGGFKGVMIAVAGILSAPLIMTILQIASAFATFGAALTGLPVGVVVALAAAGAAIYRDWENVSRVLGEAGAMFGEAGRMIASGDIIGGLNRVGDAVNHVASGIRDALMRGVFDVIRLVFGEAAVAQVQNFLTFIDSLPARFSSALSGLGGIITAAWADVEGKWAEGTARIREAVLGFASWLATAAMDAIRNAVSGIADAITSPFRKAADYISSLRSSGALSDPAIAASPRPGAIGPRPGALPARPVPPTSAPSAGPADAAVKKSASIVPLIPQAVRTAAASPVPTDLTSRAVRSGGMGAPQQVAVNGSATIDVNVRSSDGLKVASTESRSEGLISRVNLNRGPSMATG